MLMISDVRAFWLLVCGRRAYFNMLNLKSKLKNEFSEWKINMNEDYFIWLAKVFAYTNHAFNFLQIIKFDMWPAAGKRTISDFSIWCMRSHAHMPPQVQLVRYVQKIARNTSIYDNYFLGHQSKGNERNIKNIKLNGWSFFLNLC